MLPSVREKENHESRLRQLEEEMEGQVLKLEQQLSEQVRAMEELVLKLKQ